LQRQRPFSLEIVGVATRDFRSRINRLWSRTTIRPGGNERWSSPGGGLFAGMDLGGAMYAGELKTQALTVQNREKWLQKPLEIGSVECNGARVRDGVWQVMLSMSLSFRIKPARPDSSRHHEESCRFRGVAGGKLSRFD